MAETARLLFVHAHPDDESLNNGATIAHYVAKGAQARVVTCTLGEEGEVIGERWAGLAVDRADQLGGYRVGELTAALRALGISEPIYLGGAGRWRDSGMEGTAPRSGQRFTRFVDSDEREAVGALVAIIREQRPHVVITYDPNGGYGHPDHVRAHVVTTAAVPAAGSADGEYPGEPWTVPKFYWTVLARSAFKVAYDGLDGGDVRPEWTVPQLEDIPFGFADEDIDAVVETGPDAYAAKVAALAAHATQVSIGPTGRVCAVSNNFAMPILGDEHYVLVAGSPGERDERGWETDLLAGLGFDGAATR